MLMADDTTGPRRPELAATAQVLHGYFVCGYFVGMALSPAAAVLECEEAVAALTTSDDRARRAEALVLCATVLMRAQEFERSLDALSEAHDLLEPAVHGWQLALHDLIVAWNLALLGRLDDAEPAAHSSVERFDAQGEVWLPVDSLSILALIAEAQGDLDGACSFNPSVSADAMVGQAAVARRLGDLSRARGLLDAAGSYYRNVDLPAGQTAVLAGLAWWAVSARKADDATGFAADASQTAAASGDSAIQLLAETAVAAVRALVDPTRHNVDALVALAQQRAQSLSYRSLTSFTDEPDVAALAARLALPGRSAATRRRRPPRAGSAPS